ncbi:MAG: hypothetical protein BWY54_00276 [Candidatus Dependentiae bacterium ADurb.Bin331]|nr:MAG: hypothetical protein BWY54_00276 [Candidatus Dependentiae bacterium ADurb.Bin331]
MKCHLIILVLFFSQSLTAMSATDQAKQCRLYQNCEITPENLFMLSKKMPGPLQKTVNQWSEEKKNFLHKLIPLTAHAIVHQKELTHAQENFHTIISNEQLINSSAKNATFKVDFNEQPWIVKCVGPQRRASALNNENNKLPNQSYMTPSHVAGYLRALETINSKKLTKFKVPETYLAQIPERTPIETSTNDENCFVVQEYLPDFKSISKNTGIIATIDEETLYQLYTIIKAVPLWDFAANIAFDQHDECFTMFDLEQSWEEPNKFFNKDTNFVKIKINNGIEDLGLIIKLSALKGHEVTELHRNFVKFVQNDDYWQKLGIPQIIKNTFTL